MKRECLPCPQDSASIQTYSPKLWHGTRRIHVKFLTFTTLRAQVFHRNKVGARGSIRKAPDVITWTIDLAKLRAAGDKDAGIIIKAWNMESSRQQQLLGSKAQTLKNVLDLMPQQILDGVVIPAVHEMGWGKCPWSDECFATKRIFPGSAPRTGTPGWKNRLTVTELSMKLMLKCQINRHKKLSQTGGAAKITKAKMDELAEHAALVHWLAREVQGCVAVADQTSM